MLESKIEELTKAIVTLTEFLHGADLKQTSVAKEKSDTKIEQKPVEEKTTVAKTHDDLKAACLKSSRADGANKSKIKALLKEYGATKAVDVAVDKLEEVINKIEQGEF